MYQIVKLINKTNYSFQQHNNADVSRCQINPLNKGSKERLYEIRYCYITVQFNNKG